MIIISEGLYETYQKVKSKKKPKVFAKETIKHNGKRYSNSQAWIKAYFMTINIYDVLSKYKSLSQHHKTERYLIDLVVSPNKNMH